MSNLLPSSAPARSPVRTYKDGAELGMGLKLLYIVHDKSNNLPSNLHPVRVR